MGPLYGPAIARAVITIQLHSTKIPKCSGMAEWPPIRLIYGDRSTRTLPVTWLRITQVQMSFWTRPLFSVYPCRPWTTTWASCIQLAIKCRLLSKRIFRTAMCKTRKAIIPSTLFSIRRNSSSKLIIWCFNSRWSLCHSKWHHSIISHSINIHIGHKISLGPDSMPMLVIQTVIRIWTTEARRPWFPIPGIRPCRRTCLILYLSLFWRRQTALVLVIIRKIMQICQTSVKRSKCFLF